MRLRASGLSFCIVILFVATFSRANIVEYTNRALFQTTTGNSIAYDFEVASGFPAAPAILDSLAGGPVALSTAGVGPGVAVQTYNPTFGQVIGGRSADGGVENGRTVVLTFSTPLLAVGFDDVDLTPGFNREYAIITANFLSGASQTFLRSNPSGDFSTEIFWGITSTDPITSVSVYSGDTPSSAPGGRANVIDNIVLPEPATLSILAASLVLVLKRRRPALRA